MSYGNQPYFTRSGGEFIYWGPFSISDDHGCFHVGRHGCGPSSGCYGNFTDEDGKDREVSHRGLGRSEIVSRCLMQIQTCDAVIAYINKLDSYATYFELGYARAKLIPVYLYVDSAIDITETGNVYEHGYVADELWFIKQSSKMLSSLEIPENLLTFPPERKYKDYLQSHEWKMKAQQKRNQEGNRCQLCNANKTMLHVHHRTYQNLYNEEMSDLVVLCDKCHKKFHDKSGAA